jgi:hypothetical protein
MLKDVRIYGHFPEMHRRLALGDALTRQGLKVSVNRYCVRVLSCSHFILEVTNGNVSLDADAETVEEAIDNARLVSTALANEQIRHQFTVMDENDEEVVSFGFGETG